MEKYKAMLVTENENGEFTRCITERNKEELPQNDVEINVKYSSLNYKDALSASGNKGVTRKYPHTPGIDAAGVVTQSNDPRFNLGDKVLVTGYDLGMNTFGGFSEYIRVPGDWIVNLPDKLSLRDSMIYGTAGFTAALSVMKLIKNGVHPSDGEILVTGATGGVGSMAVAILKKLNYEVIALTGKPEQKEKLVQMGAKDIVTREEFYDDSKRPLIKGRWAGVVDTVGGLALETALKSTEYGGSVTCCGNVADHRLTTTVYPFILRGVSLLGVDSVQCSMKIRQEVWNMLAAEWKPNNFGENVAEIPLEKLNDKIALMLAGKLSGRTIINLELDI